MIFDADLTGIKAFYTNSIQFNLNKKSNASMRSSSNEDSNGIIKLFGSKFTGIKYFKLTDLTNDMYTLWLGMKSNIHKNDTIIDIDLSNNNTAENMNKTVKFIKQHKFKIRNYE